MTVKEKVLQIVRALPDDASIEDAMERLLFLAKVEKGLEQAEAGETLSHEEGVDPTLSQEDLFEIHFVVVCYISTKYIW